MSASRARLASNVMAMSCSSVGGGSEVLIFKRNSGTEIAGRLSYWHLVGLRDAEPYAFPKILFERANLNERQLVELEAWLQEGSSLLWPELEELRSRFSPPEGRELPNPFEGQTAEEDEEDEAAKDPDISETPSKGGIDHPPTRPRADDSVETEKDGERRGVDPSRGESADSEVDPDPQAKIVAAPLETSMLVLAPPGTGKTHVLVERLVRIVSSGEISNPSDEILLLSFTRAAVTVMKDRILDRIEEGAEDDLRYCSIRTFDSFATRCLMDDHDPESFSDLDYDHRIDRFNRLVTEGGVEFQMALERLGRIRFLFVDEIQDLVGVRARMVLNLARVVLENGGAVTVMGDPAQAIYDYQVRKQSGMDSRRFLEKLRNLLSEARDHREIRLKKYFRYSDPELKHFVNAASRSLGETGAEPEGQELERLLQELDALDLDEVPRLARRKGQIAILARRNADVYQLARWFREKGLDLRIITGSRSPWPGWIGRLVLGYEQDHMSRKMAERRFEKFFGESKALDFDSAWQYLAAQGLVKDDHFDLPRATSRILTRDPIAVASGTDEAGIVLSNIHKSKGREFDHVLVLSAAPNWAGNPEEVRTYYVAATRARRSVALLRHDSRIIKKPAYGHGYKNDVIMDRNRSPRVAVQGLEALRLETLIGRDRDPERLRRMQEALWQSHSTGTLPSRLSFRRSSDRDQLWLMMEMDDGDSHERLCRSDDSLGADLARIARYRFSRSPSAVRIAGFSHVELVTCAFEREDRLARECLGAGRLAVVPAVIGLGEILPL
jgi:hypothetical protein